MNELIKCQSLISNFFYCVVRKERAMCMTCEIGVNKGESYSQTGDFIQLLKVDLTKNTQESSGIIYSKYW